MVSCPGESGNGARLAELSFDAAERDILTVARHYFRAFAQPETQSWIGAIGTAVAHFHGTSSPGIAVATLGAVQTMRQTRRSIFMFNDPCCRACADCVTGNERSFLVALREMRAHNVDRAAGHATILCEGNDCAAFLHALQVLSNHLPQRDRRSGTFPAATRGHR